MLCSLYLISQCPLCVCRLARHREFTLRKWAWRDLQCCLNPSKYVPNGPALSSFRAQGLPRRAELRWLSDWVKFFLVISGGQICKTGGAASVLPCRR